RTHAMAKRTKGRIANALKGRNQASATNWFEPDAVDAVAAPAIHIRQGDLVSTTQKLIVTSTLIDGLPLLMPGRPSKNERPTIADADFGVYLGIERLRVTKRMK